jgi:hypothetical protein
LRKSRWAYLLDENPDFKRWYDDLSRGSEGTAKENARVLYRFLQKIKMTPSSLVDLGHTNQRKVEDILMDFVTELHRQDKAPGYIENYIKSVKSWLRFNDISLTRKITIGNRGSTPSIEDERVPMKDELKQILNYSKSRGRTSVSLIAFSGLLLQALGNMTGSDGLEMRDFPELHVEGGEVSFEKIPTRVIIRSNLSKAKHKYFSFLGEEGCEHLKGYLDKRLASGETLKPNSPIITVTSGYEETGLDRESKRTSRHITTKTVSKEIRDAMRPKYSWRPYVLRAYFDTQLMIAENHGRLSHAYRQFFMGHKGNIEARYTTNKGKLPENVIEDMRDAYRKCQEYLQTEKPRGADEEVLRESFRKQLLLVAGFSQEEVEEMDSSMDDGSFQEMVRKRLLGSMANNGASQRVIDVEEVERFLSVGWDFVATLPDDRIVVRLPH